MPARSTDDPRPRARAASGKQAAKATPRRGPTAAKKPATKKTQAAPAERPADELTMPGQPSPLEGGPLSDEVLDVPAEGLESRPQPAKRVVIIGGGIAGLVAAFELARQGHEPIVLEAQHRVGGRVYTLRDFAPGLYAEAGAMRIPAVHDLTLSYCQLFGLEMRPFVMGNPKTLVAIGGQRMTAAEADREPGRLPFELAPTSRVGRGRSSGTPRRRTSATATRRAARERSTPCCVSTTSTRSANSSNEPGSPRAPSSCTA